MKVKDYTEEIEIPDGTTVQLDGGILTVSKEKETVKRNFANQKIKIKKEGNKIILHVPLMTKKEKTMLGTFTAHMRNMIAGVNKAFVYKLKVCSGHFPMNISVSGRELSVKNFTGEKVPRTLKIRESVEVHVEGDNITVKSSDKEKAGQVAGAIELLCKRPGFDKRVFQQGIYITEKAGKQV
jgi:large subunit ribosomal protein L6